MAQDRRADEEHLTARIAPRHRRARGVALMLGGPLLVIGAIVGGRLAMPVKELKLAPLVPFEIPSAAAPTPALLATPLVAVPASSFTMGTTQPGEAPAHVVTVPAFALDRTEVSVGDYRACVTAGKCPADDLASIAGCTWSGSDDRAPMNCVDWNEADIFCRWLGKRLPTESEWELAARGPEGRTYPWGNTPPTAERACFDRTTPCPTGDHPSGATPSGIHDLAGNLWEWTSSPYCPYGHDGCDSVERAVRGGSFTAKDGARLRSSVRSGHVITLRELYLGFRCARDGR